MHICKGSKMSEKDNLSNRFKINKLKDTPAPETQNSPVVSDDILTISEKEFNLIDLQNEYKTALLEKIDSTPTWFEYSKEKQTELVKIFVNNKTAKEKYTISDIDKDIITDKLLETIDGFGEIQSLLDNQNVSAVEINGTSSVYTEINGKYLNTEIKLQKEQLNFILKYISAITGTTELGSINNLQSEKYSITVISKDICPSGTNIKINKIQDINISSMVNNGIITKNISEFIIAAVKDRKNIIISGGTNTYKTSLLTSVLKIIDNNKRIFLLGENPIANLNQEQIASFKLPPNSEHNQEIISYAKKSEPDYIITDLNRFEPEISDMKGKIVTLRANSIDDCLNLLISSYTESGILEKFAKTMALRDYDYIIQLEKDKTGSTKITSIVELSPQKTMTLSAKPILKNIDNKKVTRSRSKKLQKENII